MLDEQDRVIGSDSCLQQPFSIFRGARSNHFQAQESGQRYASGVCEWVAQLPPTAAGGSNDHRDSKLPAKHIAQFGCLVNDMIHGGKGKVDRHQLCHRAQACHG
jgi:hypothetical protein